MAPTFAREKTSLARVEIPTRVLVVDDEPLIRWAICTALAAAGFDPVPAPDAAEARRLAAEWPPPRVAVIDCCFSNGDEQDLLRIVGEVYPACRFLIMTTEDRGGMTAKERAGGLQVIEKPFDLARLVGLVSELAGVDEIRTAFRREPDQPVA